MRDRKDFGCAWEIARIMKLFRKGKDKKRVCVVGLDGLHTLW